MSNQEWVEQYRACIARRSAALVSPDRQAAFLAALTQALEEAIYGGEEGCVKAAADILMEFTNRAQEAQEIPALCVQQLAG